MNATLASQTEDGLPADEAMVARLALAMTVDRTLSDQDYADGVLALGQERLAELTWLVGYYYDHRAVARGLPPGAARVVHRRAIAA